MARPGLLLDIGGVVIRTPFELLGAAERRAGLPAGSLGARGPFDPDGDPEFEEVATGRLAERAYWARRAERAAPLLGTEPDTSGFMRFVFDLPEEDVVRPAIRALLADAIRAGHPAGFLTNDLADFHGPGWAEQLPVLALTPVLVDGSVTGVLKPDERAFLLGCEALGLPPGEVLLVDDQPVNIDGARRAGLRTIHLDVTAPDGAVAEARAALGLASAAA